ncbi:acyl carrier protein [Actinoallomurus acaciae]|uniref:Acyl carrier protein n=1 Tax=Actinoallomurus acaciae TaxID=502577 RepID=A0ABV5YVY9_9ACTN
MRSGMELAGRYRLEAPVGRGGMGEVWRGVDLRLRRPVAVKILPLSEAADGAGIARFRREAEIAAALNHPGITTVFDIDEHTDGGLRLLFLVMELMRGRDLAAVLHEHPGGPPIAQVRDWAVQILDALAAAHGHGVVHRDIKPANLFLTDDGRVKVCDFGIARLPGATRITATGSVAGTPLYMAPEQIEGHTVDERTDLYSFGCVLYQLLTGTTWVDTGSSVGAILYQHLNQTPVPPRSVRPDIDDHVSTLVMDLLAKRPGERPRDAATVAARLCGRDSRPTRAGRPATLQEQPDGGTRDMTSAREEIITGLAEIMHETADVPGEDVRPDRSFRRDLGIDSLTMVEVVVAAEERFDISIPDGDIKRLKTVRDATDYILKARRSR